MKIRMGVPGLTMALAAASAGAAEFEVRNADAFAKIVPAGAKLEKLAGGMEFVEGPVWVPAVGLVFSDIPANEMKKWTPKGGLETFRKPSGYANGNTLDIEGRLVTCEHGGRRIARMEKEGTVNTLVDRFEGKRLNSPNDIVVKSDGTIWFTDPPYGLTGRIQEKELDKNHVFRLDPKSGALRSIAADFDRPNGICFSPDEKRLYVADSGRPRHIRVFDVGDGGALANGRVFCTIDSGVPDGIRCDRDGRLWSSAGDGVHIFAPDGALIGKILAPEAPANLCFGGEDGKTLFITARTSLYAIRVGVTGAR
jgi:gluconolactonase